MPDYTSYVLPLTGRDAGTEWTGALDEAAQLLRDPAPVLEAITDEVILPALARHYDTSGLKRRTGRLYQAVTQRGARGNYVQQHGQQVSVGVDYAALPYARFAIEGRGPVVARKAKALRFVIDGRVIFRKRVGPAPAHDIYYLTGAELASARTVAENMLGWGRESRGVQGRLL